MYDIIIVGSGTVGLTVANLLSGLGLKICLIEKKSGINKISNAVGVNDECLFAWKICSVLDRISPYLGYNDERKTILKYLDESRREIFFLRQSLGVESLPKGVVFLQNKIDEILLEYLQGKAELNFDEELLDLVQSEKLVTVKTTKKTYETKYVIAADGKAGKVRKLLNINLQKLSESKDEWLVLNLLVKNRALTKEFVEVFCGNKRSVVSCPLPYSQHRLEISLQKNEENILQDEQKIAEILRQYVGFDDYEIISKSKHRFLTAIAKKYYENRVALCGDAAHCTSPFASSGLVSGIRDSLVLYEIFKNWKVGEKVDFASYQKQRYKKQLTSLKLAMKLEKIMRPSNMLVEKVLFTAIRFLAKNSAFVNYLTIRS